jgi:hypothetical protein
MGIWASIPEPADHSAMVTFTELLGVLRRGDHFTDIRYWTIKILHQLLAIVRGTAITSQVHGVTQLHIRSELTRIVSSMTIPYCSQSNRCDIDAIIGVAPAGFSKESLSAALPNIEHKSILLETLHYYEIVFLVAYDIVTVHPDSLTCYTWADLSMYNDSMHG